MPSDVASPNQIGLACRISPSVEARRLSTARAWWFELPDTYRQLTSGELSERIAEQVVTETRPLDPEARCHVDKQLAAATITQMGFGGDHVHPQDRLPGITGQTRAHDINIELQLMMPLEALLDPHSNKPATIPGYGPLPVDLARNIMITSNGPRWWRRLFTAPNKGPIIGSDPARRTFGGRLAKLIRLRDQACRDPHCMHPSATLTTSFGTATEDLPAMPTGAAPANAATTSATCQAGRSK